MANKKKVLIVKIGAIGDVVRTLSLLNYLKEEEITWLCGKAVLPLLEKSGRKLRLLAVDEEKLFHGKFFERLGEIGKIWFKIAFRFFDRIIVAHADWRYGIFSVFSFGKKKTFSHRLKKKNPVPGRPFESEYIRLAFDRPMADFEAFNYPRIETELVQRLVFDQKKIVALAPGGAKNVLADDDQRRWPVEFYAVLAEKLMAEDYLVLLTGAPSDLWTVPFFEKLPVANFIGRTGLLDLLALFQKCDLVIANDAGPLHLAVLVKTAVLGLFGPTDPRVVLGQGVKKAEIFSLWKGKEMACAPCFDGRGFAECKTKKCLLALSPEEVLKKAKAIVLEREKRVFPELSKGLGEILVKSKH
ncbi:MAG: glycosyltransferase family 9 protein [Parachlamydiales bacterium]|jgi:heptosyltransferase-2